MMNAKTGDTMRKAFGALFGASMAVTAGSYLVIPVMVVAVLFTIGEGIGRWWPFLVGLVVYAIVLALVIAVIPNVTLKALLLAVGGLIPPLYIWSSMGRDWTGASIAAFVAATVIGSGLVSLSASGMKLHGLERYGYPP
jgi:signal transduction histidine kinase